MTDQNHGDLQKYRPAEVQRASIEEVREYQLGVEMDNEFFDKMRMRDFKFLFQFLPENIQAKLEKDQHSVGLDHMVRYIIARLEELAGESDYGRTIDVKPTVGGEFKADFSQTAMYAVLLEKFREFSRMYISEE